MLSVYHSSGQNKDNIHPACNDHTMVIPFSFCACLLLALARIVPFIDVIARGKFNGQRTQFYDSKTRVFLPRSASRCFFRRSPTAMSQPSLSAPHVDTTAFNGS